MSAPLIEEEDFIRLFEEIGPAKLAKKLDAQISNVLKRRKRLEEKHGRQITGPDHRNSTRSNIAHPKRINVELKNGVALIGSDAHYWPEERSTAHRAFVHFAATLDPKLIIMNGDAFDGASISRHPPIGWTHQPTVQEEIETCQDRLHEIVGACKKKVRKIWSLGNHDARFETRIATVAPEFAKVAGTSLSDHFPLWEPCWSTFINDDVVVKHRFKGGIHATHNNAIWSGKTMITGHLHSAKVTPFTDYNGTRYGVDTGCLANPDAAAFDYTEDNPKNWRSGFAVLTFKDGGLLMPELVTVWDDERVQFRGELIRV